jgi:hypothetical protein
MIKSANQQYKESGSNEPFKSWLLGQQKEGNLKDHETMLSADGETEVTTKEVKVDLGKWNMLAVVSVVSLLYGLMKVSGGGGGGSEESASESTSTQMATE